MWHACLSVTTTCPIVTHPGSICPVAWRFFNAIALRIARTIRTSVVRLPSTLNKDTCSNPAETVVSWTHEQNIMAYFLQYVARLILPCGYERKACIPSRISEVTIHK